MPAAGPAPGLRGSGHQADDPGNCSLGADAIFARGGGATIVVLKARPLSKTFVISVKIPLTFDDFAALPELAHIVEHPHEVDVGE